MEASHLVIPHGIWKRQILGISFFVLMGIIAWITGGNTWPVYLVLLLFVLLLSFVGETEIDQSKAQIIRRWSFWKIFPLRHRHYLISDFASIGARFKDDGDGDRLWFVQLQTKTGKRLEIKWFGPAKELPVEAFNLQTKLADVTGLPIKNDIH
jgi:hypothetical protein